VIVLATEATCVNDGHKVAGTLDRLVQATRDIIIGDKFIAKGTVFVLDIKTGQLRFFADGTTPDFAYWVGYAVQVFLYADSVPYDTETETRGEWPWPVSTDVAMIAHLDVRHALKTGEAICRPIIVDLAAGRLGAELCKQAKNYERMAADIFTLGGDVVVVQEEESCPSTTSPPSSSTMLSSPSSPSTTTTSSISYDVSSSATLTLPRLSDPATSFTPEQQARRMLQTERKTPDEGGARNNDASFAQLELHYQRLTPDARAWLAALSGDARRSGVSFHGKEAHTVRRFEILRGLINLAEHSDADDELVRMLVASVVDADWPLMPCFGVGHVVGALDATEATRFATLVDSWCLGELVAKVSEHGSLRLVDA